MFGHVFDLSELHDSHKDNTINVENGNRYEINVCGSKNICKWNLVFNSWQIYLWTILQTFNARKLRLLSCTD